MNISAILLAGMIQIGPVMYINTNAIVHLVDNESLSVLLEVSPDDKDILPGIKSIASQMVFDCSVPGRQRIAGSVAFAENYAQGNVVLAQPGVNTTPWQVFTHKSTALKAWQLVCIF